MYISASRPRQSVSLTRADRTKRVKDARNEAQKEIEDYRKEKEDEYQKFEKEVRDIPQESRICPETNARVAQLR